MGFVHNHLQVAGRYQVTPTRWCSSGEMFWQEWNDDERPAFFPTNNCAPPLTCFQIRRWQAQDFIVPFYDCHNTLYGCNRHMGWVPTVGIELLLNSWKDNYLGALGKTPSMYVHMYVECLECLFSGVQTLITFVIKRKMYFAHCVTIL